MLVEGIAQWEGREWPLKAEHPPVAWAGMAMALQMQLCCI